MLDSLTKREQEILYLITQGLSNKQIAEELYLSPGTIKTHSHNIYSKLGVSSRTQALIKAEELGILSEADSPVSENVAQHPASDHLPTQLTPFIGRKAELSQLSAMIEDERMRLITILGSGGMGKTRLAIELARRHKTAFKDGAIFIPLAPIADVKNLAAAMIDALGKRLQAGEKPEQQLLNLLTDQHMLLVLDNFEHLPEGVSLLTEILHAAPDVKIIVTSRERLNLSGEVVFVLGGLAYKSDSDDSDVIQYEAVQLLLERMQFVNAAFEPQAEDWPHIRRICQLTQGMPLALILAVGWLELLTLEEIASEIAQSIDILESQLSDLPARQRSMRATIAYSWKRLNPEEQQILASLSVFRGGFTREAASTVANANLRVLQKLINRSFISAENGHYEIHELLRQFAEEELSKDPDRYWDSRNRHCEYYANFLYDRVRMAFSHQQEHITEIRSVLDNIRTAWAWALKDLNLDAIHRMVETLAAFLHQQSGYIEGVEIFADTIDTLNRTASSHQRDLLIAIMSADLGWYNMRLGRLDETEALFTHAHNLFKKLGFPMLVSGTAPLPGLAIVASIRGHYAEASQIALESLKLYEELDDLSNQAYSYYALIGIKLAQGEYQLAKDYGERAVAIAKEIPDLWLQAYCLIELGNVARAMDDVETARQHYQASYEIKDKFDDPEGVASALNQLGQLALLRADYNEASKLYLRTQAIYREIQDKGGLATALHGLAQVALATGDDQEAREYLLEALKTAVAIEYVSLIFMILLTIADLHLKAGRIEPGLILLGFVQQYPSSNQETKDKAVQILNRHEITDEAQASFLSLVSSIIPPDNLEAVVTSVQSDLSSFL